LDSLPVFTGRSELLRHIRPGVDVTLRPSRSRTPSVQLFTVSATPLTDTVSSFKLALALREAVSGDEVYRLLAWGQADGVGSLDAGSLKSGLGATIHSTHVADRGKHELVPYTASTGCLICHHLTPVYVFAFFAAPSKSTWTVDRRYQRSPPDPSPTADGGASVTCLIPVFARSTRSIMVVSSSHAMHLR
jgi:hypothetical protein